MFSFSHNLGYIKFVFVNIFITAFSILVRIDYEQSAVILTIQSSSCVEPALNQSSDRLGVHALYVAPARMGLCPRALRGTCENGQCSELRTRLSGKGDYQVPLISG